MARTIHRATVAVADLDRYLSPRTDLLEERRRADGSFEAAHGPFHAYRRTVNVQVVDVQAVDVDRAGGTSVGAGAGAATVRIEETTEFHLHVPFFGFVFTPLMRRALRRRWPHGHQPWWAPPERLDARAVTALGALAGLSLIGGYLNTLLTQTITFAADEFGSSDSAQGVSLALVRAGIVLATVIVALADKRGRRVVVLAAATAAPIIAATGALTPSLPWLTVSQILARPLALCVLILIGIVAAEEMPAGSRAYAVGLLAMSTGLGAGFCVMSLPLADIGTRSWRLVYAVPLLFLFVVRHAARHLDESRRFRAPHAAAHLAGHARRFWLLATTGLLLNLLVAPASAFQNRYLKRERGYSASRISLYTLTTNTPGALGIVVGGRLADTRGRRKVGAIALAGGAGATIATFFAHGWALWSLSAMGAVVGAAAAPALGVYQSELFPTGLRGRANGIITALALAGSGIGLVIAGFLVDRWDRYGPVMALLGVGPLVVVILVAFCYPETARVELEVLNPEDAIGPPPAAADRDADPTPRSSR